MRAALLLFLLLYSAAAHGDPVNTLEALRDRLGGCLRSVRLHSDSEATVRFMLRRDGSIIGTPRITYSKTSGDEAAREADAKEIADGLHRCMPVDITDGLGGAIAGRPLTYSFGLHKARDL